MGDERTTVEVEKEIKERLNEFCNKHGRIQYHVVGNAIKDYLDKLEEKYEQNKGGAE